jgi:membrane protease YdiL (CAAX protease family)
MSSALEAPPVEITPDGLLQVQRARQGLLVFAGFLIPLSLFGYWFYATMGNTLPLVPSFPLMLAPGLAAVLTRLLRREGFADVSFRLRNPWMSRAYLLAFGLPLIVGIVAYGLACLFGLAKFDPPPFPVAVGLPLGQFGLVLAFSATAGTILGFPSAAGEEIGWRGYLLPRMIDGRLPQPILLNSLIWGVWHLPVLFAGVYAVGPSVWLSATGLIVGTLAAGSILAWIRLATRSIWPYIIVHAAWNAMINGGFTLATQNAAANFWIGESGILVVVTLALVALLIGRSWKPTQLVTVAS